MASKKSKRKTLSSLLWETIGEEWGVWLAIAILVFITLLLSNQLATWLEKSAFIKLLDSLSKLGLLVAVIAFLREIPKWKKKPREGSLSIGKRSMQRELQKEDGMEDSLAVL